MNEPVHNSQSSGWLRELMVRSRQRHVTFLRRYLGYLSLTVLISSVLFHLAMSVEGREQVWWIGPYWTVSTMTTLGLGDVSFNMWPGQLLTALVVMVGLVFMLVLLPLLLVRFPQWVEAKGASRVRKEMPEELTGHVVLTHRDPITQYLVERLVLYGTPYVLIVSDIEEALKLTDLGWSVMVGELDSPDTYRAARLDQASLMAATGTDVRNSNAVFTARGVAPDVSILSTADRVMSTEVLQLAGSTRVVQLSSLMGRGLARRVIGGDAQAHVIGRFGEVLVAEANAARTPLVGKNLMESNLRDLVDVSVVGKWERGDFEIAGPETEIGPHTVLMLAGTREQLLDYSAIMAIYNVSAEPILVIGGGRVGRATAQALSNRGIDYRVVESKRERCLDEHFVQGDAADPAVLESAGIKKAPTVIITIHDDDMNIFLSLYVRRLRPDVHIVSRATFNKNVETLHRAGADFVLSTASMGASAIFNLLEGSGSVTITEGLEIFQVPVPSRLVGRTLSESDLRRETGCTVVALKTIEGMRTNPNPALQLPAEADIVLIGTRESEASFFARYVE
jgi:voltage-gated potassium channel